MAGEYLFGKNGNSVLRKLRARYPKRRGYTRKLFVQRAPVLDKRAPKGQKAYYAIADFFKKGKLKFHN